MLFIDTAEVADVKRAVDLGIIKGVTTNPKILSNVKGGFCLRDRVKEIGSIVQGPVSVELTEMEPKAMADQAEEMAGWCNWVVVKVPMVESGLLALAKMRSFVQTNVTLCMNFNQSYLACQAGATYVSIFAGRIKDTGYNPLEVICQVRNLIDAEHFSTKIIVGSIRHPQDVADALNSGAHIVTVPSEILWKMWLHPMTDKTYKEFQSAYEDSKNRIV